jgi:hypothetical protein
MTARILLPVAFGALFASPAAAMAGKFTKQALDMDSVPVPVHRQLAPQESTEVAPRLTLQEFLGLEQARVQELNNKQIIYLRHIIKLSDPDDPQLPDYHFRLGELFAEKYRYFNNLAHGLDEPIFRAERGGAR